MIKIEVIFWDEVTRQEKDRELCEVVGLLKDRSNTLYGEQTIGRLRNDFLNGVNVFKDDNAGRLAMIRLMSFEQEFLSAYIRQVIVLSNSFAKSNKFKCPDLEADDYITEGCMALVNSVQHYDGRAAFMTLLHCSIRFQLSNFIRKHDSTGMKIGRKTRKIKSLVSQAMNNEQLDFEEACAFVAKKKDIEISDKDKAKIQEAFAKVVPFTMELNVSDNKSLEQERKESIHFAIETANLTTLEKRLIVAHMEGNLKARTEITENEINPHTGRLWTKQALSNHFLAACDKIKVKLLQLEVKV